MSPCIIKNIKLLLYWKFSILGFTHLKKLSQPNKFADTTITRPCMLCRFN